MKKRILFLFLCLCFAAGCAQKAESFMDINWTRETEADTESIFFGSDGSFRYFCGCGNAVNDADLCEGYIYDAETAVITLKCIEVTEEMITEIKVNSFDGKTLELDFDGELRRFYKKAFRLTKCSACGGVASD